MDTTFPVDVLLVTVTDVEARTVYTSVKQKFNREPEARYIGPKTYYDLGTMGGARTFMVRSEMGAGGPSGSMATVTEAISELSPSAVIMVGIAFGVDPENQSLGDVLVSKQLVEYELQRVGTDRKGKVDIIPRGDRVSASPRLLDRFRDGELTWDVAKVRFGVMLSGQKLVDNIAVRDQLVKFEREAIGGEMEGAGLYAAAELKKVDWILAKAICDWADGNKAEDKKQRQQLAAQNAAGFVFHVLERGGLAGNGITASYPTNRMTQSSIGKAVDAHPVTQSPQPSFQKVSLVAWNGQYVRAEDDGSGRVIVAGSEMCKNVIFDLFEVEDGKIALRACNEKYLCAEGGGGKVVSASRERPSRWETFTLESVDGDKVALGADSGQWLSAKNGAGYPIVANESGRGVHETFRLIRH